MAEGVVKTHPGVVGNSWGYAQKNAPPFYGGIFILDKTIIL